MSGVRDPAFWKRFSYAVHLDEEYTMSGNKELDRSNSWLSRQQAKRSRRTKLCWFFWLAFIALVAGIVAIIIWLLKSGVLDNVHIGDSNGTDDASD